MLSQHTQTPGPGTPPGVPSESGSLDVPRRATSRGLRKRLACHRCQSRKIKVRNDPRGRVQRNVEYRSLTRPYIQCDGLKPCSACQRARTECVDGKTTSQGPSISRRSALPTSRRASIVVNLLNALIFREAARLLDQNRLLLDLVRQRCPDVDLASITNGASQTRFSHEDGAQQSAQVSSMPIPTPYTRSSSPDMMRAKHSSQPRTAPINQGESTGSHVSNDIAHEIGMIPLSAGVNKYVGPSSGFSIAKLVLARADQASGYSPEGSQNDESTAEARCRSMFTISPTSLPTSIDQAMQLSSIYFEQVHPRYPFLHQQSHFRFINEVYNNPQAPRSVRFQVTMVLAIAATILSRRLKIQFSGEGLCAAAMEYTDEIDFQSSTEGVQCLLLISMFTLHSPFLGINPWYLNYQCLAAVLDLGLQQDLSIGGPIDPFEREMRTRIFWVVFSIDRIIATTLGRPVGLRDESCNLRVRSCRIFLNTAFTNNTPSYQKASRTISSMH